MSDNHFQEKHLIYWIIEKEIPDIPFFIASCCFFCCLNYFLIREIYDLSKNLHINHFSKEKKVKFLEIFLTFYHLLYTNQQNLL